MELNSGTLLPCWGGWVESFSLPLMKPVNPVTFHTALGLTALLTGLTIAPIAQAESLEHTRQLLATRQCAQCNLTSAGLVFANLVGADLQRANLSGANLSQANLQGADLRGANLMGASLYGANLTGAKLDGADLMGADLRTAHVLGANLEAARLTGINLRGAIGLAASLGSPTEFYQWAMEDQQGRRFGAAIENFSQALARKPNFAHAYLGRAVSRLQNEDKTGAISDAQRAQELFTAQGNANAAKVAQTFFQELTAPPKKAPGGNGVGNVLLGLIGTVLQLALPLL